MKKTILLLSLLVSVLGLSSCSPSDVRISDKNFPDWRVMSSIRRVDTDQNGYLSREELEACTELSIVGPCNDLTGIEYLTGLETLTLIYGCSDLSAIENLTNLKSFRISEECPDLSVLGKLPGLERIELYECVFTDTFVYDNEMPAAMVKFRYCVFEKGILFKNNSAEDVTFDSCATGGDVVLADCDALKDFSAEFDHTDKDLINFTNDDREYFEAVNKQSYNVDLSGCDNMDSFRLSNRQKIASVDVSNCSMLSSFTILDWRDDADEIKLNISGCSNIDDAYIGSEAIKEIDISDCPHLISAAGQTRSDKDWCTEYESEDGRLFSSNEKLVIKK